MKNNIKILVVDDHQIMIDGIKALLKNEKNIEIVGEVPNGLEALHFLKKNPADIVITDISMPEMSGIELTRILKKEYHSMKVIVLTMHNEGSLIKDIIEANASGYLLKNTGKKELVEAINKVVEGEKYFSKEVTETLVNNLSSSGKEEKQSPLTLREVEIVRLIAKEYSNEKIAETLFISERTVETHRKNIFKKTNTKGVVGLIKYAYERKLI